MMEQNYQSLAALILASCHVSMWLDHFTEIEDADKALHMKLLIAACELCAELIMAFHLCELLHAADTKNGRVQLP